MTEQSETTPMSPEEFARRMRVLAGDPNNPDEQLERDTENLHEQADALLCEVLRALGYGEGVAVFEEMDKWYA